MVRNESKDNKEGIALITLARCVVSNFLTKKKRERKILKFGGNKMACLGISVLSIFGVLAFLAHSAISLQAFQRWAVR
jgi:hypothetical protein